MFRRPGAGRSKATADTLCQKCLQRGHYSYECKAPAQERPYKSRPSRTQQLLNPKLKPKLTTEVPEDLVRKKGIADEILKKKEEDRKRVRSPSTSSVDSVSTISTNRSRSPSRSPPRRKHHGSRRREHDDKALRKRSRRSVSADSRTSRDSYKVDRNTRRRLSSFSPDERGRRRTRSQSRSRSARAQTSLENARGRAPQSMNGSARSRSRSVRRDRKRPGRQYSVSRSRSRSRSRSADRMDTSEDRNPPNGASRGRWEASPPARRQPSRSPSPYRGSRDRSLSPFSKRKALQRSRSPYEARNGERWRGGPSGPTRGRFNDHSTTPMPAQRAPPAPPRERSLSPYSKRLALTKAMNNG